MFRLFSLNFMFLIGFHTMCLTHGCIDMIKKNDVFLAVLSQSILQLSGSLRI